jgi:hypothetical protein
MMNYIIGFPISKLYLLLKLADLLLNKKFILNKKIKDKNF